MNSTMISPAVGSRSGGRILVDSLLAHSTDTAYAVAGESYLEALAALYDVRDSIRLIGCRQEGGAAFMAEAHGKLTGRPGICFVTRAPGACNASIGLHTAYHDSTPMILFVGQVKRGNSERESFQEVDYRRMFGPVSKWVAQIDSADRIPEFVDRAFHLATSGRPGPVVLALPQDMLQERADVAVGGTAPQPVEAHPSPSDLERMRELLSSAKQPVMMIGGSGWTDAACRQIIEFAEANGLPVCSGFRRQDIFANNHPNYIGALGVGVAPSLQARLEAADLLLIVGARLSEMNTLGYQLLSRAESSRSLVHVYPDAAELNRVCHTNLAIVAGIRAFAGAVAALPPLDVDRWSEWRAAGRADYEKTLVAQERSIALDPGQVMLFLREELPSDAIVTIDAGNFSGWPQRFLSYRRPGRQLAPTSGAMGYAVPAAVGAAALHPDRPVIAFVGDGGFLMTGQELATALQQGSCPIILVFNNSMLGTIRMHQERHHPGRTIGTDLTNPDFVALASAYGAHAELVRRTEEFAPAFERARQSGKAAVIELRVDRELITTRATLSDLRRTSSDGEER